MKAPPIHSHAAVGPSVNTTDNHSDCASSILPAELWLDTLCLCHPSPRLPATSRSTSLHPGSPPHRIWTHRHIFLNPQHDPKAAHAADSPAHKHAEINNWYRSVAQCPSHLAYYLKAHVPTGTNQYYPTASGLAPEPGVPAPPTVLSVAMVQWLFSEAGPFGKQSRQANELDVFAALEKLRPHSDSDSDSDSDADEDEDEDQDEDEDEDEDEDLDAEVAQVAPDGDGDAQSTPPPAPAPTTAPAAKQPPRRPPLPTWRLIPDPFLLATFFIRTSQLDLFELTLTRLRTLFPALLTSTAPFSLWSQLMLDNRTQLRSFLSAIVRSNDDPHMSYPTFLCFLALIDWSKPALDVVARVFADSYDPTITANLITSTRHMMDSILGTLHQLTSPASDSSRVLSILAWFQANNAHINLEDFPYLSNRITGSYPIFADVFLLHDLGNVPFLFENPARYALGSAIVEWAIKGHPDLLHVALENDLLDDAAKGKLMRFAAEKADEGLMATVALNCTGSDDALKNALLHSIRVSSYNDPDPPNMYSTLLNTLVTYGPASLDPTSVLIQHSETWHRRALSIMMLDLPAADALNFTWDYPRYLRQQLMWANGYWEIPPPSIEFMGALIDKCVETMEWAELDAKQAATACALRLVAAVHKAKFGADDDEEEDGAPADVTVVDEKCVAVVEFLLSVADAKLTDARASAGDHGEKTFEQLIPAGARHLLGAAIRAATSFSPATACTCGLLTTHPPTCPIANPRAMHNWVFDTLYTLDRGFAREAVAWRHPSSVRVWHRFEPAEVAKYINVHRTVGMLRIALCESPADQVAHRVAGVVDGLPRLVLENRVFVLGLRGLMRMQSVEEEKREAMVRGLDASGWGGEWREWVASVTPLPEDDGDEDAEVGEEEEGEEFSLFD